MYLYTPDEIDKKRAHHQAVIQGADDVDVKRIGNLGELAFEQFCREYLPVELWAWENEEAIRRCNTESFSGHDFKVFWPVAWGSGSGCLGRGPLWECLISSSCDTFR